MTGTESGDQRNEERQDVQAGRRRVHLNILARHGAAAERANNGIIQNFLVSVVTILHALCSPSEAFQWCFYSS